LAGQGFPVFEITVGDQLLIRMCAQPTSPTPEQLLDLVVADPVVLFVVQHGHEDVQVRQEIAQTAIRLELDGKVGTAAPLREPLLEWMRLGGNRVSQRLEETAQILFTAPAGKDGQFRFERKDRIRQLLSLAAPPRERAAIHLGDRNAEE